MAPKSHIVFPSFVWNFEASKPVVSWTFPVQPVMQWLKHTRLWEVLYAKNHHEQPGQNEVSKTLPKHRFVALQKPGQTKPWFRCYCYKVALREQGQDGFGGGMTPDRIDFGLPKRKNNSLLGWRHHTATSEGSYISPKETLLRLRK